MSAVSDQGFYPSQGYHNRLQSGRDYSDRYHQVPAYSAQQSLSQPRSRMSHISTSQDYAINGYAHQIGAPYAFAPMAAPFLPPIRVPESFDHYAVQHSHAHPEVKQKEEKPTGGVAQHLDYEMDLMASFVAEMSHGMYEMFTSGLHVADINMLRSVSPTTKPTSQFRKYVSQILSSTRLPSSTIMLGLFYLAERMKLVSQNGEDTVSSGTVYRMLTTCLLLGSKFLDDNTFQNRSWAEVSSIPVHELNSMELKWLQGFNWEIHNMMYDKEEGFYMWTENWHAYEEKAHIAKAKEMQKLAPIETDLHRGASIRHQPLMSPEGPIPPQYQQGSQYDTQWVRPLISEYSPPSAPHSGPSTPDYYPSNWSYPQAPPAYSRQSWNNASTAYAAQRGQPPSYHHTPTYHNQTYGATTWVGHGIGCGCTLCAKHPDYYFSHSGYGMQPVVG